MRALRLAIPYGRRVAGCGFFIPGLLLHSVRLGSIFRHVCCDLGGDAGQAGRSTVVPRPTFEKHQGSQCEREISPLEVHPI